MLLDKSSAVWLASVVTNLSLLILGVILLVRANRSKRKTLAMCFLIYVAMNLYLDYTRVIKRFDNAFELNGALSRHVLLPEGLDLGLNAATQILLLVVMWMCFAELPKPQVRMKSALRRSQPD